MRIHSFFRGGRARGTVAVAVVVGSCLLGAGWIQAADPPPARGTGGAVASADRRATMVGIEMLRHGGNAADAAVAVALTLAVVFPEAGNLGGGGFAVARMAGRVTSLDFRETAPAGARSNMYLDRRGRPIPEKSLVGPLAAGVPGSPRGLYELHRKLGKLPWAAVVAPAIRLARDGFRVSPRLARDLRTHEKLLSRFPETASLWLPGGRAPRAGTLIKLPGLAALLEAYAEEGPEAITSGPAAAAVEIASRRHGGVLSAADLGAYRPVWRAPVQFDAWGWHVASMGLPSSGGIILGETVGILQRLDWGDLPRFGADRDALLVEAWRRAFADRFLLGDPLTSGATADDLLAPAWLSKRAAGIDRRRATPSAKIRIWPGERPFSERRETTQISVADGVGNVVSMTTTLNGSFGCGLVVPGLDMFLNNEMDDFATAPGRPNLYGLIQGRANGVGPGKRMLSSMSPTVLWQGTRVLALGSPGGSRIPTATLQVMLNVIVDGDQLQAAVDRPRLHHQWLPDRIDAEPDALAPETDGALRRRGYEIRVVSSLGEVNAVAVLAAGQVEAAADPRGPDTAAVVRPLWEADARGTGAVSKHVRQGERP
ncbi:MAG: gamma-glutamyltransferase [Acidobacteria bacterium]|nr:gamma-glutamyltransferase [Acidobacteriota bacterium]